MATTLRALSRHAGLAEGRPCVAGECLEGDLALERIQDKRYDDALAFSARSRDWPEHLGAGKPYNPDEHVQDCIESYCRGKLGKVPPKAFDKASLEKLKQELKSAAPWKCELLVALYC